MVCKDHYLPVPWLWSLLRRVRGTVGHVFLLRQVSGLNEIGQGLVGDVGPHPVASDGSLGRHGEGWWSMIKRKVSGLIISRRSIVQTKMAAYEGD